MLISSAREIAKRGDIGKPGEFPRNPREGGQREVLNDPAVLVQLGNHFQALQRSEDGTL
ncbi:MAG TPA: hypothetical protein VNH65_10765 [Candidatus Acidoferrum sp.]|nr:hypothetical protein [Candidatus Acidoferrum sp.]